MSFEPSIDVLRKCLVLDHETGALTWATRDAASFHGGRFTPEHAAANWNALHAGRPAFVASHMNGYLSGTFQNRHLLAHRVVFAMAYGYWPRNGVDHVNGIKTDNRPCNLREADHTENARNQKRSARNATGITGVSFDKARNKYFASIRFDGRTVALGRFNTVAEAAKARAAANTKYGFHQNHGRAQS